MDDRIESAVVTVLGVDRGLGGRAALSALEHVDGYEPPSRFSNRVSSVPGSDPTLLEGTHYLFADHVPSRFDVQEADPNVFIAEYTGAGLSAGFTAEHEHVEAFLDALAHVLAVADLELARFEVAFDAAADVRDGGDAEDVPGHPEFHQRLRVDAAAGRSEVQLSLGDDTTRTLADPADAAVLRQFLADAVEHVEDLLP